MMKCTPFRIALLTIFCISADLPICASESPNRRTALVVGGAAAVTTLGATLAYAYRRAPKWYGTCVDAEAGGQTVGTMLGRRFFTALRKRAPMEAVSTKINSPGGANVPFVLTAQLDSACPDDKIVQKGLNSALVATLQSAVQGCVDDEFPDLKEPRVEALIKLGPSLDSLPSYLRKFVNITGGVRRDGDCSRSPFIQLLNLACEMSDKEREEFFHDVSQDLSEPALFELLHYQSSTRRPTKGLLSPDDQCREEQLISFVCSKTFRFEGSPSLWGLSGEGLLPDSLILKVFERFRENPSVTAEVMALLNSWGADSPIPLGRIALYVNPQVIRCFTKRFAGKASGSHWPLFKEVLKSNLKLEDWDSEFWKMAKRGFAYHGFLAISEICCCLQSNQPLPNWVSICSVKTYTKVTECLKWNSQSRLQQVAKHPLFLRVVVEQLANEGKIKFAKQGLDLLDPKERLKVFRKLGARDWITKYRADHPIDLGVVGEMSNRSDHILK